MRDRDRIKRMCEKLQNIWEASPDQRLGQLLLNLSRPANGGATDSENKLWAREDDSWEELLDKKLSGKIREYKCLCSGGDTCFIVNHWKSSIDISFPTREEAEKELKRLNDGC